MKKAIMAAACAAFLFISTGCASISTPAGIGAIYTDVKSGEAVTSNSLGKKVGTAKATNILGLVTMGDASIQTAAKSAGIKKISHVDSKKTSIIGIFGTYTVYVYGD